MGIKHIKTFNHTNMVRSILLLEDKNILISAGDYQTKFWDLNNENNPLKTFDNIYTYWNNGLERIDEDKIIVCNRNNLIIISISKLEIIKEINNNYRCYSIKSIKNKGIVLVGGYYNNIYYIYVYRSDNYELIQTIYNAHGGVISGFVEINNHLISSSSWDGYIKNWLLK